MNRRSRRIWSQKRRAGHDELLPLTDSGIQQMIRQAAREAGIKKRVHD